MQGVDIPFMRIRCMDQRLLLLTDTCVRGGTVPVLVALCNKKSLLRAVQDVCRGRKRLASAVITV